MEELHRNMRGAAPVSAEGFIVSTPDAQTICTGWWFGTFSIFPYIGNVIIPIDEIIFFRGVAQPPTSVVSSS